jgi:2-methylisocitrate lyase-like PEP mutase family enzyme
MVGYIPGARTAQVTECEQVNTMNQLRKAEAFKALHESGETFIIPNPWDAGSALLLQELGFKALATTSAGFAHTLGRDDGDVSLAEKLAHCRLLASVTEIPVSVDFENGFADTPEAVAENLKKLAETGVVGGSIEDYSAAGIYDFELAVERVAAAAEAVATLPFPFMLTARAEGILRKTCDLDEAIVRIQAFEKAGADVLYIPGLKNLDEVRTVVASVSRPINVLAPFMPGVTLADYAENGVARVSIGGALAGKVRAATRTLASELLEL